MKNWDIVDLLRHDRHDWLNQIQLIKAYLSLGKTEKVEDVIDRIIDQANRQTSLSNLDCPTFAGLLLTYNWENPNIPLEYEVLGAGKLNRTLDSVLTEWFRNFLKMIEEVASSEAENPLMVRIILEKQPVIQILLTGTVERPEILRDFLLNSKVVIKDQFVNAGRTYVELSLDEYPKEL